MQDVPARVIAIAGLAIAVADIVATWWLWTKSGPRMRVRLRRVEHPSDRLQDKLVVEVYSVGRMPVRIGEVGLEDRVPTGQGSNTTSYMELVLAPTDGGPASRVMSHTDLPLVAEASMPQIIQRWSAGRKLTLAAWAKDGNGRKKTSGTLTFTTPRWPA